VKLSLFVMLVTQAAPRDRALSRSRTRGPRLPGRLAAAVSCCLGIVLFFTVNWVYHAVRKPTEFLAPVAPAFSKSPAATWDEYGDLFRRHSTAVISAPLLAALAQVEGRGNPIARTYWRWRWSLNPFELYRPASSAVGMFQITDGTFREARQYCIHDHRVARAGPWYDLDSCWFTGLYSRVVPSHAIEMTAAYLHRSVVDLLATRRGLRVTAAQREDLAALTHLCGKRRAEEFLRRRLHVLPAERCGSHGLAHYLAKVRRAKQEFLRLSQSG
jgi:hypothetical protein